jgi:Skp family chaperone for outer membrane proteins
MNELIILPPKPGARVEPDLRASKDFASFESSHTPRWKTFAATAAALALVLGIGFTVSARIGDSQRPSPELIAAQGAAKIAADSAAEALNAAQAQRQKTEQEIAALRGNVESLKSKLDAQAQKTHAAEATIASLQKNLSDQRAEAAAATSQLQARIEKVQSQAAAKPAPDRTPVSSIGKPLPKPSPQVLPASIATRAPLGPYRAFVLRDVEDGRAVVEGPRGLEEVGPGDMLPGGARVERIERRGPNWVVLTDRGLINPDGRWDD